MGLVIVRAEAFEWGVRGCPALYAQASLHAAFGKPNGGGRKNSDFRTGWPMSVRRLHIKQRVAEFDGVGMRHAIESPAQYQPDQ
jgi:hypothetical protein